MSASEQAARTAPASSAVNGRTTMRPSSRRGSPSGPNRFSRICRDHAEEHVVRAAVARREVAAHHAFAAKAGRLRHALGADVVDVRGQLETLQLEHVEGPVAHQTHGGAHHAAPARPRRAPVADLGGLAYGHHFKGDHRQQGVVLGSHHSPAGDELALPVVLVVREELHEVALVVREGHAVAEARHEAVVAGLDHRSLVRRLEAAQADEAVAQLRRVGDVAEVLHAAPRRLQAAVSAGSGGGP